MVTVAENLGSTVKLNDGNTMPLFGLGVWQSGQGASTQNAVSYALKNGYKMIDTATIYGNQSDVGEGLKKSGVKREEVYVVTKLWKKGYESCRDEIFTSLKQLDCGYIDLYLIHSPSDGHVLESYKAMMEFQQQGLIKSIGVSNFDVNHIEPMKAAGMPVPAVNQVELHPYQKKPQLVSYCRDNNVAMMGYSPLMNGKGLTDPKFVSLAEKLKKTVGQILIRYSVQMGYITIPKSVNEARIKENAQVFDWAIPKEDMAALNSLPEQTFAWDAIASPWKG